MATRKKTTTKRARGRKGSAVSVGQAMATEVLRFREQSLQRRAQAIKRLPPRVRARVAVAPPKLVRAAGGPERAGVLVAEGDSWFDYPWHDILRMLEDDTATTSSPSRTEAIALKTWLTAVGSSKSLRGRSRRSWPGRDSRSGSLVGRGQ